jgi:hypothetical protein
VLADCRKIASSTASKLGFDFGINENYDFKITDLLIGFGSLMICTHDLTIFTKTKGMAHYCRSFGYGGKGILNKRFYHSKGVSVPAED